MLPVTCHRPTIRGKAMGPLLLLAFAACSAPPSGVASPASPSKPTAGSPSTFALGLVAPDGPSAPVSPEITPASALPALAASFVPVPLPADTRALVSAVAVSDREVWMLAAGGPVLRWDGARAASRGSPTCFTDSCCGTLIDCKAQPEACAKAAGCQVFDPGCALRVGWSALEARADGVIVGALIQTGGMRGSLVESRLGRDGRWTCEQGKDDVVEPGSRGRGDPGHAQEMTVGGASIRFEGPARLVNNYGGYSLVIDGRRLALPEDARRGGAVPADIGFTARAPGDLWLWRSEGGMLWRGNGLGWTPVKTGLGAVSSVWTTEPGGAVWVLGAADKEGSEQLLRLEPDKGTAARFEVPGAQGMLADGPGGFWLYGTRISGDEEPAAVRAPKAQLFRWDGRALARMDLPLVLGDLVRTPAGELWVVGMDRSADTRSGAPAGAAFRLVAGGKP